MDQPNRNSRNLLPVLKKNSSFRIASLYHSTSNLGDEIQTIAADQFVESVDIRFDREKLCLVQTNEDYAVIMNGWFSHFPENCFPPSPDIHPVIIGFHITPTALSHFLSDSSIAYFKTKEPIGCRDVATCHVLKKAGVKAYFSRCLTLLLPKRNKEPDNPRVVIVDLNDRVLSIVPDRLKQGAVYRTHIISSSHPNKFEAANEQLDYYRDHAGLVITSRLHCALPCVAMGIPVVLFSEANRDRMMVAESIGLSINRTQWLSRKIPNTGGPVIGTLHRLLYHIDTVIMFLSYKILRPGIWRPNVIDLKAVKRDLHGHLSKHFERLKKDLDMTDQNIHQG